MSFEHLHELIVDELGREAAERVRARVCRELGGVRLTIPDSRRPPRITVNERDRALREAGWNVRKAAQRLGISERTLYRWLQPRHAVVLDTDPGPRLGGRIVR